MEDQQKYDIKDLRHIADEIEPGLNVYSQILRKIAHRIKHEYQLTPVQADAKNDADLKDHGCKFCSHLAYCVCE